MSTETYRTIIERIARHKSSTLTVFADFCRMVACALAAGTREEEYFEAIKGYSKEELLLLSNAMGLLVEEMEAAPFTDQLGTYYLDAASNSSKQARGEFYTPQEISRLMARMIIDADAVKERGLPISLNEPACGAGGMVLAVAELFAPDAVDLLRVTCQDINPIAADMCFINTSLWGIPAQIIQGNVLTNEIVGSWKNVHWLRVGEDARLTYKNLFRLISDPPKKEKATNPHTEMATSPIKGDQVEFDFDLGSLKAAPLP